MAADIDEKDADGPKAKIFISYSRKDGFEPLIDPTEIYAFEDWWKRIEGLIGKADTIIFTLSPQCGLFGDLRQVARNK
jgi:hypothetical protein